MNEKRIVVPGELLSDQKKKLGDNVYVHDGNIHASVVGILSESNDYISVIALNGPYIPTVGNGVVCVVKSEISNGYFLEYNSLGELFLPRSMINKQLKLGDVIFARVSNITENDFVDLDNINVEDIDFKAMKKEVEESKAAKEAEKVDVGTTKRKVAQPVETISKSVAEEVEKENAIKELIKEKFKVEGDDKVKITAMQKTNLPYLPENYDKIIEVLKGLKVA